MDEALWEAKIHPEQSAATLNEAEINLLHRAIIDVLARAVEAGGTTIRTYLNALGEAGHFQVSTRLWSNRQSLCPLWYPDRKTKVAQRGTHYCPFCQQLHAGTER